MAAWRSHPVMIDRATLPKANRWASEAASLAVGPNSSAGLAGPL
jgi:hypothetical protein